MTPFSYIKFRRLTAASVNLFCYVWKRWWLIQPSSGYFWRYTLIQLFEKMDTPLIILSTLVQLFAMHTPCVHMIVIFLFITRINGLYVYIWSLHDILFSGVWFVIVISIAPEIPNGFVLLTWEDRTLWPENLLQEKKFFFPLYKVGDKSVSRWHAYVSAGLMWCEKFF